MTASRAYFDFGAHHGDGLRQMTDILGVDGSWDIHLYEPNPFTDTQAALRDYPHAFSLTRAAVWKSSGQIAFLPQAMIDERCAMVLGPQGFVRKPIFDGMGSAVDGVGSCEPGLGGVRVLVDAVSITDALERTSSHDIFFKMDIEASEYDVLDVLLAHPVAGRVRGAYVEWHRLQDGSQEARKAAIVAAAPFPIHDWH